MQLHTLLEIIAANLALFIGAIALVRFYGKKSNSMLLIAIGFLGTALLDGFHVFSTSSFFSDWFPLISPSLNSWSWIASRVFLSLYLWLSWLFWKRETTLGEAVKLSEQIIFLLSGSLILIAFLIFAFVPLPRLYYFDFFFHRPHEFIPAFLLLLALLGYVRKGLWKHDYFEFWLVLSLIVGFIGQVLFMPLSSRLFDTMFNVAHILKNISYIFVLVGLTISMYYLFKQAERSARALSWADEEMQLEIEERKWAEEMLKESRIYAESIVETIREPLLVLDANLRVIRANRSFYQTFKVKPKKTLNKFVYQLDQGHWNVPDLLRRLKKTIYKDEHLEGYEMTREFGPIGLKTLLINARRIYQEEVETNLILLTIDDITERKRTEEALQERTQALERSNHDLEQFAYVASHDLQEPLRMVSSYCQLLQRRFKDKLDSDGNDFIDYAVDGAKRMTELINDLLIYSRVDTRGKPLKPTDCNAIVNQALNNLRMAIEQNGATVTYDLLPTTLMADEMQLIQLFQNLIGNAIKFRSNKLPEVQVSVEQKNGNWVFSVRDNGIGIDSQYAERVFIMFQRLHSTLEYAGTGIGLAICKKIVERHRGKIWLESQVGKGSQFYFSIPVNGGTQT